MEIKKEAVKRTSKDFVLSILASLVYTFARQIVVLPILAARMPDAEYGTLLTVIGLVNVFTALVGGTLNNIRLVQAEKYQEQEKKGDFLLLCTGGSVLCVGTVVALCFAFRLHWICGLLLAVHVCTNNFYQYAVAYFRLNLDFKRNLLLNVIVSIAYIPVAFLFASAVMWPLIFVVGDVVGLIYTAIVTRFYKEGLRPSPLLAQTGKMMLALALINVIGNLLMYADRMIIYPILGAEAVSYYSTASFFGKSAGIVMVPIAGVLLGYFSQKGFRPSKKLFALVNIVSAVCLVFFMGGCWLFAPFFTKLLYPTLYAQSAPYIMLANFGAVINIAGNMAQPMILKCCSTRWLVGNQILYGAVYVVASVLLLPTYGLLGFCWATILANTVRLLTLYGIGFVKF